MQVRPAGPELSPADRISAGHRHRWSGAALSAEMAAGRAWWRQSTTVLVLIGMILLSATAAAQEPASGFGRFQALSSARELPPGSAIDVDLATDAILFPGHRLDAVAEVATTAALLAQGFQVVERGPLVLRVRVTHAPAGAAGGRRDLFGPRGEALPRERSPIPRGERVPEIVDPLRVPLGPPSFRSGSFYSISFTLFRRGREPIWSATIEASGRIPDPDRLVDTLTRTALADLGNTVEREFTLSCVDDEPGTICLD